MKTLHSTFVLLLLCLTLSTTACADLEEGIATSPLIGATRIEERGQGQVAETHQAGSYTYLRLQGAPDGVWHVVSLGSPEVGDQINYRGYAELENFHSAKLGRAFPRLVFTSIQPGNQL